MTTHYLLISVVSLSVRTRHVTIFMIFRIYLRWPLQVYRCKIRLTNEWNRTRSRSNRMYHESVFAFVRIKNRYWWWYHAIFFGVRGCSRFLQNQFIRKSCCWWDFDQIYEIVWSLISCLISSCKWQNVSVVQILDVNDFQYFFFQNDTCMLSSFCSIRSKWDPFSVKSIRSSERSLKVVDIISLILFLNWCHLVSS